MNRVLVRTLQAAVCVMSLCGLARADVLYDNLGAANSGADPVVAFGPLADSFSTLGSAVNLTEVKVLLTNSGVAGTGTVDVSLLSDSSASPGSPLTAIGSISDVDVTSTLQVFTLNLSTPYTLDANTRYWIQLSSSDGSTSFWGWSSDTTGTGLANEFYANTNGVFSTDSGPYQMQVTVSAVPEPSSLAILGLGTLVGLGFRRRLRGGRGKT